MALSFKHKTVMVHAEKKLKVKIKANDIDEFNSVIEARKAEGYVEEKE